MEKLIHLKEQIEKLSIKLRENQELIQSNQREVQAAKKTDDEFKQTLSERGQLIDKVAKAETDIKQLIAKIEKMTL